MSLFNVMTNPVSRDKDEEIGPWIPLHRQFERHAELASQSIAITSRHGSLSYSELNRRANHLAYRLIDSGVGPNVLVGLCMPASLELMIGMLAILKAGGAYVPMDPGYPQARLGQMLAVSEPPIVLTTPAVSEILPHSTGKILCLDADRDGFSRETAGNPAFEILPDHVCYVMFTSGTTGDPNGVVVTHANVSNLFGPVCDRLCFDSEDTWSLIHSCSFGFSVWEIWGAFVHGATLAIVPEDIRSNPDALVDMLKQEKVTVLSQTPSAFRQLLVSGAFRRMQGLERLRLVAFSGEAVDTADLCTWFGVHKASGPRMVNTYAITETAGRITIREYQPDDLGEQTARNVGRPVGDTDVWILDERMQPVPTGAVGELVVAGPGVACGYLQRPELTAERFLSLQLNGASRRVYRTKDRARLLENGDIEFLGRADNQVKIRGYRIELGEIEDAIRAHPAVADAAVKVGDFGSGDVRLEAYVVAQDGGSINSDHPSMGTQDQVEIWPSLGEHQLYDDLLYDFMGTDHTRLDAYRRAFEKHVPGKVVLDVGTGKDAVLARMCANAGAEHVYAVELLEDAAAAASQLIHQLGLSDRITVIQGDIRLIDIERRADVCTQGIVGNISSADGIIPIWNSAQRLFAPDCLAIPLRCSTYIAAVELPETLRTAPRFNSLARQYLDRLFGQKGSEFDVRLCVRNFPSNGLISEPVVFEDLDFSGPIAAKHAGYSAFKMTRAARFDGFLLWTRLTTMDGETVDSFSHQQAWLPVYFPMTDNGVALSAGTEIYSEWSRTVEPNALCPDYSISARLDATGGGLWSMNYVTQHDETEFESTELHRRLFSDLQNSKGELSIEKLRTWVGDRLPAHMIPSSWVWLDRLPLSSSGKLDRAALGYQNSQQLELGSAFVAPATALERDLASLWAQLLSVDRVGTTDSFFDLGGDSILAVRLTTELQRMLDDMVFLAAIFDAPTVGELATYLTEHHGAAIARRYGAEAAPGEWEEGEL